MAKKFNLKAKQRKQKIVAAVLGVVLLAVLGFSIPYTLKMLQAQNGGSQAATTTPAGSTTTPATPLTPPTLGSGSPSALSAASASAQPAVFSQLVAFDRFQSKDPFAQQVQATGVATSGGSSSGAQQQTPARLPSTPAPSGSSTPKPAPAPVPAPTIAVISVNGAAADVLTAGQDFPVASPMFHLVAVSRQGAKVAIAGGSYASGSATALLRLGKKLTLVNTADGTRYELVLLWLGTGTPPPEIVAKTAQAQASGSTSASSTTAATTTTPAPGG